MANGDFIYDNDVSIILTAEAADDAGRSLTYSQYQKRKLTMKMCPY